MKKTFVLILGILTFFAFSSAFVKVEAADPLYDVTIISFFSSANKPETVIEDKSYGSKLTVSGSLGTLEGYSFDFWVVNGIVRRDLALNHEFIITGNMEIMGVFSSSTESAVLFMDSNGKLIETVYTATSDVSPTVNVDGYTKPNYVVDTDNRWDKPLNNITVSDTRVLQYKIDVNSEFALSVVEGQVVTSPNGTDGKFKYNTPVTVTANASRDGEKFSHWQLNGQKVSTNSTYSLSVLEETTITAVYVLTTATLTTEPLVAIRDVALRSGSKSYIAQMYLPEGHTLIDYGFLRSTSEIVDLTFDDLYRVRVEKYYGPTNEYLGTFSTDIKSVKAYLVTEYNDTLYYSFSDQINYGLAGAGTEENPYQVASISDLNNMRNNLSAHYRLTANLDLTDYVYADPTQGWLPIGSSPTTSFTGSFDGGGYYIKGLFINRPTTDNVGLFGHIGVSATTGTTTIKNIILVDVNITGNRGTGSLVGRVTGNSQTLIQYSGVIGGSVTGTGATGGLVGSNNSFTTTGAADRNPVISRSFAKVNVYGVDNDPSRNTTTRLYEKIGGLAGCSQKGTIRYSYSLSTVDVTGAATRVGGLAGCNIIRGTLHNSYSAATVTAPNSTAVGVLIGRVDSAGGHNPVYNAYWNSSLNGTLLGIGSGTAADGAIVTSLATSSMQGTAAQTNMTALDWTNNWQTSTSYPVLRGTQRFVDFQLYAQGLIEFSAISS